MTIETLAMLAFLAVILLLCGNVWLRWPHRKPKQRLSWDYDEPTRVQQLRAVVRTPSDVPSKFAKPHNRKAS